MSPVFDSLVRCCCRLTRLHYSAAGGAGAGAGAAHDGAAGAQHVTAAGAQHVTAAGAQQDTGAGSQQGSGQHAFFRRNFLNRRPENRRQRVLPQGSQHGSGSQQTGAGAQHVGAAGAQQVAATGAQQDGAAQVASGAQESQLDRLKWPNRPASTD
jgi:hypothetical protein